MEKAEKRSGRQNVVATKVSHEAWLRLNDITERLGLTPYRLVQEVVDTLILYMDEGRQLSPDMQQVIDCFEQFEGWGNLVRVTDVDTAWRVVDAVYFLQDDRPGGAAGTVACWSKAGFMGQADYTFNKSDILDMVVRRLFPDLSRSLQLMRMQTDTGSTIEAMRHCIHQALQDDDRETIRRMFADCGRTDYGRPSELVKYIRHSRKNIDAPGKRVTQLDLFGGEQEDGADQSDGSDMSDNNNQDYEQG